MPLPALQTLNTDRAAIPSARAAGSQLHRTQDREADPTVRAEGGAFEQEDRDADPPLRAARTASARRRGAVHPLLDREAAVDRRRDAVEQGAGAHHGALCRSRRHGPGDRARARAPARSPRRWSQQGVDPARLVLVEFNPTSAGCCARAIRPRPWCRAMPTPAPPARAAHLRSRPPPSCPACRWSPSRSARGCGCLRCLRPDAAGRAVRAVHLCGRAPIPSALARRHARKPPSASG